MSLGRSYTSGSEKSTLELDLPSIDDLGSEERIPSRAEENRASTEESIISILILTLCSNIWTLVLVAVPVLIEVPPSYIYYKHK
jgi:hypothetical protein